MRTLSCLGAKSLLGFLPTVDDQREKGMRQVYRRDDMVTLLSLEAMWDLLRFLPIVDDQWEKEIRQVYQFVVVYGLLGFLPIVDDQLEREMQ
jgi:hypothetical protein